MAKAELDREASKLIVNPSELIQKQVKELQEKFRRKLACEGADTRQISKVN